ncbi:MAG: UvrB/UvrC motif-containing protein [Patescibacteria group bacterium]|nr:UvrB/UvrC motif-containing protein [Patescibacteria group bacterium]MDE1965960.1 UvrB/UvrC motif-containing protein [Patescibacteria group bacterium]
MERADLKKFDLPDVPGVYLFKKGRTVLYVGKATSLRDRVRSYFDDDLIATRGPRIVDMVTKADRVAYETAPTVLEALVREAALIRKYRPSANAEGKDDKTFLYACITDEDVPRVLAIRGKDIDFDAKASREQKLSAIYGPFPSGYQLREGLRLIRRIFPFFDTDKPVTHAGRHHVAKLEFNRQLGQYPRNLDRKGYARSIRNVSLFLSGSTKELRVKLERDMRLAAKEERFEDAAIVRGQLFALDHIQDVSLIKDENLERARAHGQEADARIEAYDTAHISGTDAVAVMTVLEGDSPAKREYRTFRIRGAGNDDIASLRETLSRRLPHTEWPLPRAIVVDGGRTHKKAAEAELKDAGVAIPVVAVVKDDRHRPREVIGSRAAGITDADAVLVNSEAHRFAVSRHRALRSRRMGGTNTSR